MKKFISSIFLLILSFFVMNLPLNNLLEAGQDYWNAEEYFQNSSSQKDAASDLLKFVPIKGDERILDVGCGDGKITAEIAAKIPNGSILGVDISPSMIDFAKEMFPHNRYHNINFSIMDAQRLDYHEEFDVIFSFTALQWMQNHDAFLKGAYQGLKSTGTLAITMPMGLPSKLEQSVNELIVSPIGPLFSKTFLQGGILSHHLIMTNCCPLINLQRTD